MKILCYCFAGIICCLFLSGCGAAYLMERPNLYAGSNEELIFADTPDIYRVNPVKVFYVTDRERVKSKNGVAGIGYSSQRGNSIHFGNAVVDMGWKLDWEMLKRISADKFRDFSLPVSIVEIDELGMTPPVPEVLHEERYNKEHNNPNAYQIAIKNSQDNFMGAVEKRIAEVNEKEVFVFVHGFDNTFEDAVCRWTQLWHFMGRVGVPVIYSWPAAAGGLTGYFVDSEVGDASVTYLKSLLEQLAEIESIEKIHLVGHSRGCDISVKTLVDMAIKNKAKGREVGAGCKLGNIVLIAPDIDIDFVLHRVMREGVINMPEKFTMYGSTNDKALKLSGLLRAGMKRLGMFNVTEMSEDDFDSLKQADNINIIMSNVNSGGVNHSYHLDSREVSSDVILLLRYGFSAGKGNGRPLVKIRDNIWNIEEGYPYPGYDLGAYLNK